MKTAIAFGLASLLLASACTIKSETVQTPRPAATVVVPEPAYVPPPPPPPPPAG